LRTKPYAAFPRRVFSRDIALDVLVELLAGADEQRVVISRQERFNGSARGGCDRYEAAQGKGAPRRIPISALANLLQQLEVVRVRPRDVDFCRRKTRRSI